MAQLKTNGTMTDEEKDNFQEFLTAKKGQQVLDKELPGQTGMVVVQAWVIPSGVRPKVKFIHLFERNKQQKKWTYKGPYEVCGTRATKAKEMNKVLMKLIHSTLF